MNEQLIFIPLLGVVLLFALVVRRINELESERSTLNSDIETANRTILEQIETIKALKDQLERLIGENRRSIRGIKWK